VKDWHPISKLMVLGGVLAIGYVLVTDGDEKPPVAVAASAEPDLPEAPRRLADIPDLPTVPPAIFALRPIGEFTAMVDRPLFSPRRRPSEPVLVALEPEVRDEVAPQAGPVGPLDPSIAFVGSIRRGGESMALITRDGGLVIEAIHAGDDIDGWTVMTIDDRALELGYEDQRYKLEIFK